MNAVSERRPGKIPVRASCAEIIFQHPLSEIFMGNRRGIIDTGTFSQGDFLLAGCRNNAVNHGIGKCRVRVDPVSEFRVAQASKTDDGLAQNIAITLKVVAALARERGIAIVFAILQCGDDRAKSRAWRGEVFRVMANIFMGCIQPSGVWINKVSAFGYRQTDNSNRGI